MDKKTLDYAMEKTHELIHAASCSDEARTAAQAWLNAIGTDQETVATKKYITELEGDIIPIDGLIGFAESDAGVKVFGADKAKEITAHAREIKSKGAKYCDCPACTAAQAILEKKEAILK